LKFATLLLKALAAGAAAGAVIILQNIVAVLQGVPPSDVSATMWAIISTVGVFLLNFLIGKIPAP
jgi:hypothetical protein